MWAAQKRIFLTLKTENLLESGILLIILRPKGEEAVKTSLITPAAEKGI